MNRWQAAAKDAATGQPSASRLPLRLPAANAGRQAAVADTGPKDERETQGITARYRQIPRVFVPVDGRAPAAGTKVYVPADLYQRLWARMAQASHQPGDWLMTRASSQVLLSRETRADRGRG